VVQKEKRKKGEPTSISERRGKKKRGAKGMLRRDFPLTRGRSSLAKKPLLAEKSSSPPTQGGCADITGNSCSIYQPVNGSVTVRA